MNSLIPYNTARIKLAARSFDIHASWSVSVSGISAACRCVLYVWHATHSTSKNKKIRNCKSRSFSIRRRCVDSSVVMR